MPLRATSRGRAVLITGDYTSLAYSDPIPRKGTAVKGQALYEDGHYLGRTTSTPARAAFIYDIEPDGNTLQITYTPEKNV